MADREAVEAAAFVLNLRARGVRDKTVLGAMERVPREVFAPSRFADLARSDIALPLSFGQTMTAPGTVAAMLVALAPEPGQAVLEIGTGSGYVSALLARLGCRVTTVERYAALADAAAMRFGALDVAPSITMRVGDGLAPLPPTERFDRILLNGAVLGVPPAVTAALEAGGRLIGAMTFDGFPRLIRMDRGPDGQLSQELGGPLRIAPLVAGRTP